ncbi:hypothetical protein DENIS_0831 [Desulfonema ishimotonii]|uniref:Uncharacterized protein n=1 Tax=Desulfonema ishimotonii TaxID=45657 RepID=A0A401FSE6_9BACT|nr:hypothetical protein [Desulfonema ishimotonii]GBC59889.1 hypothetical protein DENIS_0831 [Desulfonema ishimotonii]
MNKTASLIWSVLALLFAVFGIWQMSRYTDLHRLEMNNRHIRHELELADRLDDPAPAAERYRKLNAPFSEVGLRILNREWQMALDDLHRIGPARGNAALQSDVPALFAALKTRMDRMADACGALVNREEALPEKVRWRVYNLRGAIHLMAAYTVLETEQNEKKAVGLMKAAISDFKSAVAGADRSETAGPKRNIPRWNLELLVSRANIRKIGFTRTDAQRRLDLRENLETMIPERGGYAAGEPTERKVEK